MLEYVNFKGGDRLGYSCFLLFLKIIRERGSERLVFGFQVYVI